MKRILILLLLLELAINSYQSLAQINLNQGLIMYLPFNGNTLDASGNGNNAMNNGAILTTDQFGNPNSAYYFDGINDFMEVIDNASLHMHDSLSMHAIVRLDNYYQGICYNNRILSKGTDLSQGWYALNSSPSTLPIVCTNSDTTSLVLRGDVGNTNANLNAFVNNSNIVNLGQFYCLTATYKDSVVKVYVDGVLEYSYQRDPIGTNNLNLFIGKHPMFGNEYWWKGVIDELRIYNRALNEQEVQALCTTCNSTSEINITTGIDKFNNQILFNSSVDMVDPNWKISNPSVGYSSSAGITPPTAYIAKMQGTSLPWMFYPATTVGTIPPEGNWLAPFNDAYQTSSTTTSTSSGYYEINFDREFKVCISDTFEIFANFTSDNYVDYLDLIDATSGALIQNLSTGNPTNAAVPSYINTLTNLPSTIVVLNAGNYIIRARVGNAYGTGFNPVGFYLNGKIQSVNNKNSLISNNSNLLCSTDTFCGKKITILPSITSYGDTSVCASSIAVPLNAVVTNPVPEGYYNWMPISGLSNANIANPIATVTSAVTYTVNYIYPSGNNLIVNSEFNGLNSGFSSSYTYQPPLSGSNTTSAEYTVGFSPNPWNPFASVCSDHTTGTGQMLIINGATVPNVSIWSQTVNVQPNTHYNFSAWVSNWTNISPAILQFQVNGTNLGSAYAVTSGPCVWSQFFQTWYSGASTTATISILNQSTAFNGNDFSIDDLYFGAMDTLVDSVTISILPMPTVSAGINQNICTGQTAQLNASSSSSTVLWSPSASLTSSNILNPVASPSSTTVYTITAGSGICLSTSTVTINVSPIPIANAGLDTSICYGNYTILNGSGGSNYLWQGNNVAAPNNASTVVSPASNSTYTLTVSNSSNCSSTDIVTVTVNPLPLVIADSVNLICYGQNCNLMAHGASSYFWNPSGLLNNPNLQNPVASPLATTIFTVTGTDGNTCTNNSTVQVTVSLPILVNITGDSVLCKTDSTLLYAIGNGVTYIWNPNSYISDTIGNQVSVFPINSAVYSVIAIDANGCTGTDEINIIIDASPSLSVAKGNDISCAKATSQLLAIGAQSYAWSPSTGLSSTTINNPIAAPQETTTYLIEGKVGNCIMYDSITVFVLNNSFQNIIAPNAFTPNGDNKNDCFSFKNIGNSYNYRLIIYNRWGEKVFETTDPKQCWDGTARDKSLYETGVYFYHAIIDNECDKLLLKGDITLLR